ncbi:MAG: hypothetical protein DMG70_13865 [Acidobacteria bacterium]|nr:MAG: hypothetical protein DMG70_13865 [Acidobacteriota bacterium]
MTPPLAAEFAQTMLCSTPSGTAYTFSELRSMFGDAGFHSIELHELPPTFFRAITAGEMSPVTYAGIVMASARLADRKDESARTLHKGQSSA